MRAEGGRRLLVHPAAGHAGAGQDEVDRRARDRRRAAALTGHRRRPLAAALALVVALGAAGCSDGAPATLEADDDGADHGHGEATAATFPAEQATTEVATTLSDYAFIGLPSTVEGPNVRFRATIRGANEHELVVVDEEGATMGVIDPFRSADGEQTLTAVLPAGSYTVECLVKEGTRTHAQLGMRRDLTVEG